MRAPLRQDAPGTFEVRRITLQQIADALNALNAERLSDRAVHTARKQLKKARASLRLMRNALSDATYRHENIALRDAARPLRAIRDCKILLETLEKLVSRYGTHARAVPLGAFRRVLRGSYAQTQRSVLQASALRSTRIALRQVRDRGLRWRVAPQGWSVLGLGLKRVYADGRHALSGARLLQSTGNLHEWRKQAQYLWHQLEILEPLRPGPIGELADQAHKLADCLGDDHDLAVLREQVATCSQAFPDGASQTVLLTLIDRRRAELQDKAIILGKHLYEERPKEFESRFGKYWRDWHRENRAARSSHGCRRCARLPGGRHGAARLESLRQPR